MDSHIYTKTLSQYLHAVLAVLITDSLQCFFNLVLVSVCAVLIVKLVYGTLLWKLKADGEEKELKDSRHTLLSIE